MMTNRKAAEALCLSGLKDIDPSGVNVSLMQKFFANMSDEQFENYYQAIKEGRDFIPIVMENLNGVRITMRNNLEVAKRWGVEFYQQIWTTDSVTGKLFLTPVKYPVLHLMIRRQIQTLENKSSIPEDNKRVDEMTDQPTGDSKGSSMSFPEILVLFSRGYEKSILEFIKLRGGDLKLLSEAERTIRETGGVSLDSLSERMKTRVKSTLTLSTLLKGAHLDNNF
jgi:hypothetical protein